MKAVVCLGALLVLMPIHLFAQQDPGPRSGSPGAGTFYPSLNTAEQGEFATGLQTFMEIDSVSGAITNEAGRGLGPTFNGNSCAQCHGQPAIGGSSPGQRSPQNPAANPQSGLAGLDNAT